MTMAAPPMLGSADDMTCPRPGCDRTFACDACMHAHLVRRYNVRYAEVFGPVSEAFVHFCDEHEGVSPSMLGI